MAPSAPELKNKGIGSVVDSLEELECENYSLPVRLVSLQSDGTIDQASKTPVQLAKSIEPNLADLEKLGILEDDYISDKERYPIVKAKNELNSAAAVCEMVALYYQIPFKKDIVLKILEENRQRGKR